MLLSSLGQSVSARTRAKGLAYFRSGAVTIVDGGNWVVHAAVRGTRVYRVRIVREDTSVLAACECPYFLDRDEICKHIWAVVLACDREHLLSGDGSVAPAGLDVDYDPVDESFDDTRPPVLPNRLPSRPPPPPPWRRFLDGLHDSLEAAEQATPDSRFANGELLYEIGAGPSETTVPSVSVLFRQRKKNGEWGKPKPASVSPHEVERLTDAIDREIHSYLIGAGDGWTYQQSAGYGPPLLTGRVSYPLRGLTARRVLPLIAASGRGRLASLNHEASDRLSWDEGPPWSFTLKIARSPEDDSLRVEGALVRGVERMAINDPLVVMDAGFLMTHAKVAPLESHGAFDWLVALRRSGPLTIPSEAAAALVALLARSGVDPSALPDDLQYDVVEGSPRPHVRVARRSPQYTYGPRELLDAVASFDYDGTTVDATSRGPIYDPSRRRLTKRAVAAEQRAIERLRQLGFQQSWNYSTRSSALAVGVDQFPRAVRTLVEEGWRVEAEGRVFRAPLGMQMHVASGVDWFELHGHVDFGDGIAATLPELLAALQRGDGTVALGDGTKGLLPEEWLRKYAGLVRFGESSGEHIRFKPSQAALLDALLAAQPAVLVDDAFARVRHALQTFESVDPLDPPDTFTGTLREYQREALGWLAFLRRLGFGGCLADDMGLGKTVIVLALIESRRRERKRGARTPSLAVVPRSLVFNWMEEARRFAPRLRVLDYTGTARDAGVLKAHDLVLTTYGTLRQDAPSLAQVEFDYVILDEAQSIKNATTAAAKAARLLRGSHRLALSGTPIENHVGELWSLFEFLNPGLLGPFARFQTAVGRPRSDREDLALLAKAVRPFILRRTKAQVAPELPDRSEQTIHCELEGAQRKLYDQLRAHYRETLRTRIARHGLSRSRMHVLEALLRLRQAACHPALIDEHRAAETSAKFDVLLPRLTEVVEEGHKALVFSQFTSFLALLRDRLEAAHLGYAYLDGQTRDRAAAIARFQQEDCCRLFLISLKAGGLGLNLTEAEYVFLLDPWWNPAVEAQAIDRAHRIGQTRHVFAYRLIARDTIEEKVSELQETKRELADAILAADAGLIRDLKPEDLDWLLS